jgi:flagellar M-ring protein FliF
MPTIDLQRLRDHGKRFADGFTPGQKAMTILGVVAVLAASFAFTRWSSTPDYAPLYTNLGSADAGEVTQELDAAGVEYKLSDGGDTILVARDEVYKTRITLSAKGVPSGGGDSYALLDDAGITTDQFTRNIDYQRALQGELARTVESIDTVAAATVNITVPRETVFVGADEDESTAAVLVKTRGGGTLDNDSVQAIVHLVSSSIPNMKAADVTVADSTGKVLHAPGVDNQFGSASQIEQKTSFEQSVANSISDFIATSLGPNHAAVTVSADLDLSRHETRSVTYEQPEPPAGTTPQTIPEHEITKQETFSGPGSGATGILGPDGVPLNTANTTPVSYTKTETQRDNAINKIEDNMQQAPGAVKRMSVAVLLDSKVVKNADVRKWTDQISAAAGIDPERDDVIQVTTVAFDKTAQKAAAEQLESAASSGSQRNMLDLARQFIALAIVALVLFFAWRAIKRAEASRVPLRVPLDLRELEAAGAAALPSGTAALDAGGSGDSDRRLLPATTGVTGDITELIERQPEDVAQTLRSWLADRRT